VLQHLIWLSFLQMTEEAQPQPGQGKGWSHPVGLVTVMMACQCPQDLGTNNPSCTMTRSRSYVRKQGSVNT